MLVRIPNAFASGKAVFVSCHLESGDYLFPNTDFDVLFLFFFFILLSNKINNIGSGFSASGGNILM